MKFQKKIINVKELKQISINVNLNLCVFKSIDDFDNRKRIRVKVVKVNNRILCVKDNKGTFVFDFNKVTGFGCLEPSWHVSFWHIKNVNYCFEFVEKSKFEYIMKS